MLELTKRDIQQDIEAFEGRIQIPRDKLTALPTMAPIPEERRRIKDRRDHYYRKLNMSGV